MGALSSACMEVDAREKMENQDLGGGGGGGVGNDEFIMIGPASNAGGDGRGMSRAAKRRRRKKRKRQQDEQLDDNDADGVCQEDLQGRSSSTARTTTTTRRSSTIQRYPNNLSLPSSSQLLYNGELLTISERKKDAADAKKKVRSVSTTDGGDGRHCGIRHWDDMTAFLQTLSRPLPLTFRFRRHQGQQDGRNTTSTTREQEARRQLMEDPELSQHVRPTQYDPPHNNIYQAHNGLDKARLPQHAPKLKQFLNKYSQNGVLARQELGSMLPVWILDTIMNKNNHNKNATGTNTWTRVLDLCASPGSKTLQAAELVMQARQSDKNGGVNAGRGRARVRANDVNINRLEALKDAVRRSGVLQQQQQNNDNCCDSNVIRYANVDATKYPIPPTESKRYAIVLCDVPCSGDGTSRKDPLVLKTWYPRIGNALHVTQLNILKRALQCVAVHGMVAYSTCSLNPVEDEAVVAAALNDSEDPVARNATVAGRGENKRATMNDHPTTSPTFELVSVDLSLLNGLLLRPGVSHWRVAEMRSDTNVKDNNEDTDDNDDEDESPKLQWLDSYEDAMQAGMAGACKSMWPQQASILNSSSPHDLSRCLRLLPQDQDTGGFFVAIIRRCS